ncbi:hypothetical protein VTO73DRAFT_1603 [Trametes versicolor]
MPPSICVPHAHPHRLPPCIHRLSHCITTTTSPKTPPAYLYTTSLSLICRLQYAAAAVVVVVAIPHHTPLRFLRLGIEARTVYRGPLCSTRALDVCAVMNTQPRIPTP